MFSVLVVGSSVRTKNGSVPEYCFDCISQIALWGESGEKERKEGKKGSGVKNVLGVGAEEQLNYFSLNSFVYVNCFTYTTNPSTELLLTKCNDEPTMFITPISMQL